VTLSLRAPRSLSLFVQLALTFVALVAATASGLTLVAYRASLENLQDAASRAAASAAETRAEVLNQLLRLRRERADGFLVSAEQLCGEPVGRLRFGWSEGCVDTMLREFRLSEGARSARVTVRGRTLSAQGSPREAAPDQGGWSIAALGPGLVEYVMHASRGEAALTLQFDGDRMATLLADITGLGAGGEAFLIDRSGRPLTPPRVAPDGRRLAEAAARCAAEPDASVASLDDDYNGSRVLRAVRAVPALPDACVVAHVSLDQALAPSASLRRQLVVRGASFVAAGILLSLLAARYIAAPVQRLADAARALRAGTFDHPVPANGPAEVRALGQAFAAMANDLAALVAGEQLARREAEAANRSKDQFLAMLSHELRTPLTAILGWAQTLRSAPGDPVRVERAALAIERSADAQRRLIEDLLDVSGIAAGRVRVVPAPTNLADTVAEALDAVAPRATEKGVRLESLLEDRQAVVYADPQRLQQVVWNLAWNAVKFTPAGGTVSVGTRITGGLAELTVTDTGVGIDPEFLPHVFGWFRRADRDVRSMDEGLGLGLALVRQLVELHGGSVRAESRGRGHGSTFVVTLPLYHEGAAIAPFSESSPVSELTDRLASLRVLVVDDDPGSREAVRVLLEQVGAQVDTAASAAEARRRLRATAPDVLISDIAMAHESGYTLMQTLRAEGLTVPGIALIGYARREDADKAYAAGFDVHLPKPVDPDVLVNVLVAVTRHDEPQH
jgi:signal transduction histidine kinase/CheY-like chemotaxis protein